MSLSIKTVSAKLADQGEYMAVTLKLENTAAILEHASSKDDMVNKNMAALCMCGSVTAKTLGSFVAALLIGKGVAVRRNRHDCSVS